MKPNKGLIPRYKRIFAELEEEGKPINKEEIAKELDISISNLNYYINGTSFPTVPKLFKLANLLKRDVGDFYKYVEEDQAT